MGKLHKKGGRGASVAFITRSQAIRKLQVSLRDFRRLCILKGIYPVEPKHKKKVNAGSSQNKTYYLLKDIQYLSHEPIIWKFWDFKIFMRRVVRAKGRRDKQSVDLIRQNKPFYKIDHIVRERYPSFMDAIRDMEDALSMCFLFATFPKSRGLPLELIELSRRLTLEFMHFIIETKSLRKVFISIKGYYYQADVCGQTVTWIVPHLFVFDRITDVDFQVMRAFVEFYITFLGFINYKLFSSISFYYPPKITEERKEDSDEMDSDELISSLNKPLLSLSSSEPIINHDNFDENLNEDNKSSELTFHQLNKLQNLFHGLKFFLNREVPRESLVFVIRCFGGEVSWDKNFYLGATYDENEPTITHQIVDRNSVNTNYLNRSYIQPQWVYDCVNAKLLLPVQDYFMGATLPPHLSPFVEETREDYIPPEKLTLLNMQSRNSQQQPEDEEVNEIDSSSRTESNNKTLEYQPVSMIAKEGKIEKSNRETQKETNEEKRLAVMMIPKKKKALYSKIMFGKKRKAKEVENLKSKRREIDNIKANKKSRNK